jgi:DNA primase
MKTSTPSNSNADALNKRNCNGIEGLLSRLEKVRTRSSEQWSARCPAHEDKSPSLSIRYISDGRILLRCFAGCATENVLGAIGLTFEDLYPEKRIDNPIKAKRRLLTHAQALELTALESTTVALIATDIANGKPVTAEIKERCLKAAGRINYLQQEASL